MLKKLFDYRYVYLFRDTSNSDEKIGITNNLNRRLNEVDKAINGKVTNLYAKQVYFATLVESKLHRLFKDKNIKKKRGRKNGGLTEWHRLNFLEVLVAKSWIYFFSKLPYFIGIIFILMFLFYLKIR